MKAIVVGAGGTTRDMLRRIGESWELTIIEPDRQRLEQAQAVRSFTAVLGDGTSRLVLERAGLPGVDVVVAATNDDDVNLEVCRLSADMGIHRIVAVAADPERLPDYRELNVTAFSPDSLMARRIEETMETRRISSQSFAHGRAEAIEFEVSDASPVRGKSLRELQARSFVVGAILRKDQLLIPHGETVFETGDLVTVVGAGAEFAEIVKIFTAGEARFPLDYGKRIALAVEKNQIATLVAEASHLVRNSRASSLLMVHQDTSRMRDEDEIARLEQLLAEATGYADGVEIQTRAVHERPSRALPRLPAEESIGVLVKIPTRRTNIFALWDASRAVALTQKIDRPVLLARGSHPYRRILVPARRTPAGRAAARAAIDLAVRAKASITAIAAVDPVFISGPDAVREGHRAISWLREEAAVLGLNLQGLVSRGNPVRIMMEAARESDLLVLGVSRQRRNRFQVGIVDHAASRAKKSVLLIPVREEE